MLPVTYVWHTQLSLTFSPQFNYYKHCMRCCSSSDPNTIQSTLIFFVPALAFGLGLSLGFALWIYVWIMASPSNSAPSSTSSTTPVDVTARRCTRRISLTHDKHTICVTCRDVDCSVAVRCDECREWSTESMNEYVCHKRSLISKSRKPKVTTPSASSASVTPSESPSLSQVVTPPPTSLADDEKLKNYVHSFLASMLSQQSGQVSLGSNPFVSAPSDVHPVSSSNSSPSLDFAAYQANVLGLSAEYQALGRWYFASGGKHFPAYLSAHFPYLYSDFSSGSSLFLSVLSSTPPPVQVPAAPAPSHLVSSSLPPSFSGPSSSITSVSSLTSAAFPFFTRPVAPAPSAQLPPQAPSLSYPPGFHPLLSSSPYLRSSSGFPAGSSLGAPVAAGLGVAARSLSHDVSSTPSFFRPFVSSSTTSSVPSAPSAPPLSSSSAGVPPSTSSFFQSAPSLILRLPLVLPWRRILLLTQFLVFWIRVWLRCLRLPVRSFVVC